MEAPLALSADVRDCMGGRCSATIAGLLLLFGVGCGTEESPPEPVPTSAAAVVEEPHQSQAAPRSEAVPAEARFSSVNPKTSGHDEAPARLGLRVQVESMLDRAMEEQARTAGRVVSLDDAMRFNQTLWEIEKLIRRAEGEEKLGWSRR